MSAEIKPALTPEQWEQTRSRWAEIKSSSYLLDCEEDYFAKMAISNWLLPDDDLRKITQNDVRCLRLRDEHDIADKLEALLPPE